MKQLCSLIILASALSLCAQDSTVFYSFWKGFRTGDILSADSLSGRAHAAVHFQDDSPVLIQHYDAEGDLLGHQENEFDSLGNHLVRRDYRANGVVKQEWVFENDLSELHLFRRIFGDSFKPTNRYYTVERSFNKAGRETAYYIRGVDGKNMCHRITEYNEDQQKKHEVLTNDLQSRVMVERKYSYRDGRTILEEFDGQGKLIQKVVLFEDDLLPAQP